MNNHYINELFSDSEQNKRCFVPRTNAERQAIQRLLKRGEVVRVYRNLYARAEYWKGLYESEKIRHIALSIIDLQPDLKLTSSSAAALLGYQVMKDYDSEKARNAAGSSARNAAGSCKNPNCTNESATKIYVRSKNRKSRKYNSQLEVIRLVGNERDGVSDDVRILTRDSRNDGQLLKLPHASDCVDDEIKSHLVDKSTMLFDVANNYSFRFALSIFDSAARDNVNFGKVIEICRSRYGSGCGNGYGSAYESAYETGRESAYESRRTNQSKSTNSGDLDKKQRRYESDDYSYLRDLQDYAKTNGGTSCCLSFEQIFSGEQGEFAKLCSLCYFANGLSENGGESLARGTMISLGFMVPELQHEFVIPRMNLQYRCDFLWKLSDGGMIVGELDGYSKYYVDANDAQYKSVNFNSSEDNKKLFESRNQSVIHRNIDRQAEREVLLMKECGVSKIVRFNYSEVLDPKKLEKKLTAAGVPRIMVR